MRPSAVVRIIAAIALSASLVPPRGAPADEQRVVVMGALSHAAAIVEVQQRVALGLEAAQRLPRDEETSRCFAQFESSA